MASSLPDTPAENSGGLAGGPLAGSGSLRLAWWGVVVRFLLHGLIVGTWVSRIPAIQGDLRLSNRTLGLCLLGAAVGSVVSAPGIGWLNGRFGSKRITAWSTVAFCIALALPAFAWNAVALFWALLFFGSSSAGNDISMNSQAVAVEKAMGTPTMSRFHAMFSVGGMAGAGLGGLIAAQNVGPRSHFSWASACFIAISLPTGHWLLDEPIEQTQHGPKYAGLRWRSVSPTLLVLIIVGFSMFLSEAAISDWSAVYLKQMLNAGPALAAASYAVFSVGMAVFRLLGDAITARIGPVSTLRAGALVAAAGLTCALLARTAYWSLPGFAVAGVGFSSIIPLVFSAGGRMRSVPSSTGIALVGGSGYLGFIVGPPVIGLLSSVTSLRIALFLIVALCLLAAALAEAVGSRE